MTRQHTDSYYAASANQRPEHPRLNGQVEADVCVVGSGITGASAALELANRGYNVVVLEGAKVGWGASGRSGGQMIFGYAAEQAKLAKLVGRDDAHKLWDIADQAVSLTRQRIADHNIDCDLAPGHLHAAIKPRHMDELKGWYDELVDEYGYRSVQMWDKAQVESQMASDNYLGGLFDANSGHLHPLNYTLGLARAAAEAGATFYEQSPVVRIEQGDTVTLHTDNGQVRAKFVVMCCNAYMEGLAPKIESKVMPVGTYITATEPLGEERARELIRNNMAVADINFVLDYFRLSGDHRMLFGGRVSYSKLDPINLAGSMAARMHDVFPQLKGVKQDYTWGGYVGITANRAPHFGRLADNIFFAQGFSGHGIALTGMAGTLMAEAVAGTAERFDLVAQIPHMDFPGGRLFRTPALVLAMAWYRMRDLL
ncbi:NAD(P)/FAD-dependent oxidoreductase [Ferrimonas balearica]|uniref:NAD(P)/FAD-dependent oxidoreductase n=1 Tax=Ferrimonas balearica TaxID=44012 RepID=UPI001C57B259|nr:FAD-binding oxidoreductase [Ferrimonas balearica]MBW3138256.1 FAD-binding oxidoreductase [Ferrimonas balearica]MBW3164192.1 FAD-binding oxidoreductase [Ferrimonas balearica]MBY6225163.1 FAD-binding oxidoreductase [Ferrimonas balearica]